MREDGRTDMRKLTAAFRKFANALKTVKLLGLQRFFTGTRSPDLLNMKHEI